MDASSRSIGLENPALVPDEQITASSTAASSLCSDPCTATAVRITSSYGWRQGGSGHHANYIQIDLGAVFLINAVGTRGTADNWVKNYKIKFSIDGEQWYRYTENGSTKVNRTTVADCCIND